MALVPCADLRFPHPLRRSICVFFPLSKAEVSKVVEARSPEDFTKEAVDAKLSAF